MRLKPDPIRRHPPNVLPRSVRKEPRIAITAVPLHKNMKTYTMKQACKLTGMNYEALKFYAIQDSCPVSNETRTTDASSTSDASHGSTT